jgi:oligopeptide/dipeptide ABC transporter ATP-binding protein
MKLKSLTYVLITHDPNVVKYMADDIAVMYLGRVVEYGPAETLLSNPMHPYTKALFASTPKLGEPLPTVAIASTDPQSMINLPRGCRYHPRCPFVMERCKEEDPALKPLKESQELLVACHLYD